MILSRRIAQPIVQLASTAPLLGTPSAEQKQFQTNITEVIGLAAALVRASTAIREREQLAKEQRETIEFADRAKDEFIAMLSHELRNPLAALSNAVTVLRLSVPGTEAASNAQAINGRRRMA